MNGLAELRAIVAARAARGPRVPMAMGSAIRRPAYSPRVDPHADHAVAAQRVRLSLHAGHRQLARLVLRLRHTWSSPLSRWAPYP